MADMFQNQDAPQLGIGLPPIQPGQSNQQDQGEDPRVKQKPLEQVLRDAFTAAGEDTSQPDVQNMIAGTAVNLKMQNPGLDDSQISAKLKTNLPLLLTQMYSTKKQSSVNPDQLQNMATAQAAQRQKDVARAQAVQAWQPAVQSIGPQRSQQQLGEELDQQFLPSNAMKTDLDQMKTARAGDLDAVGKSIVNSQENLKLKQAQIDAAAKQQFLDPESTISKTTEKALSTTLLQAGVDKQVVAQLNGLSAMQQLQLAENIGKGLATAEQQQKVLKAIQEIKLVGAQTATQYAITGKTQNEGREAGARADIAEAEAGAVKRAMNPQSGQLPPGASGPVGPQSNQSAPSTESLPKPLADRLMTSNQQDARNQNSATLQKLNSGDGMRADTLTLIDNTIDKLTKKGGYVGPWAQKLLWIAPMQQQLEKALSQLESMQQLGQTTGAGALATSKASPDITKSKDTLLKYLYEQKAALKRQNVTARALEQARQSNTLSTFDAGKYASNLQNYTTTDGKLYTLTPEDIQRGILKSDIFKGAVPFSTFDPATLKR